MRDPNTMNVTADVGIRKVPPEPGAALSLPGLAVAKVEPKVPEQIDHKGYAQRTTVTSDIGTHLDTSEDKQVWAMHS